MLTDTLSTRVWNVQPASQMGHWIKTKTGRRVFIEGPPKLGTRVSHPTGVQGTITKIRPNGAGDLGHAHEVTWDVAGGAGGATPEGSPHPPESPVKDHWSSMDFHRGHLTVNHDQDREEANPTKRYINFASDRDAHEWAVDAFDEWANDELSRPEKKVLAAYKFGELQDGVNSTLRETDSHSPDAPSEAVVKRGIKLLDSAIAKGTVPDDVMTYRLIHPAAIKELLGSSQVGDTVHDPGYMSTCLSESLLRSDGTSQFTGSREDTLLRIRVPKGTHAAYMEFPEISGAPIEGENELLLGRSLPMRFGGLDPKTKCLDLEVIHHE